LWEFFPGLPKTSSKSGKQMLRKKNQLQVIIWQELKWYPSEYTAGSKEKNPLNIYKVFTDEKLKRQQNEQ